ncbi:MAG: hypothetical protein J07HQW1_03260 [Haloquadratum walsbyi J07HQW1]|uniref:Uncharacterized protein n=1 Tax=Haloquadratum walsbyi J07HQW1 TaxID=1238424 RepID=U1PLU1_9EURY|nr:MAG: hypothetical protein J07HQW1_03260 [Haloquadratum walsbyi J07HQW1]
MGRARTYSGSEAKADGCGMKPTTLRETTLKRQPPITNMYGWFLPRETETCEMLLRGTRSRSHSHSHTTAAHPAAGAGAGRRWRVHPKDSPSGTGTGLVAATGESGR